MQGGGEVSDPIPRTATLAGQRTLLRTCASPGVAGTPVQDSPSLRILRNAITNRFRFATAKLAIACYLLFQNSISMPPDFFLKECLLAGPVLDLLFV